MTGIDELLEEVKKINSGITPDNVTPDVKLGEPDIPEKKWYQFMDALSRNDELLESILKAIYETAPEPPIPPPTPPEPEPVIIPPGIEPKMDEIINILRTMPIDKKTRCLNFAYEVTPGQVVVLGDTSPFTGDIVSVVVEFPMGCNSLVDVAVRAGTRGVLPQVGYISLNNVTPIFNVREPLVLGEDLEVEFRNRDPLNSHAMEVNIIIMEHTHMES